MLMWEIQNTIKYMIIMFTFKLFFGYYGWLQYESQWIVLVHGENKN